MNRALMFLDDVSRRRNYWQTSSSISKIARAPGRHSTTKIPPGLLKREQFAQQRAEAWQKYATHEEKYGWDPVQARKEYGFGGHNGTPRFKGYFG